MPATIRPIRHVSVDSRGKAYIAGTRMRVSTIAIEAAHRSRTPEEIRLAYPHLSLAQIHAALSYYHDHVSEVEDEIREDAEEFDRLKAASSQPTKEELASRLPGRSEEYSTV